MSLPACVSLLGFIRTAQLFFLIQLQRTKGERTNWALRRMAHPSQLLVGVEMINRGDEVSSACAHAHVRFSACGLANPTEPWAIAGVGHHSFALIWPMARAALLNAETAADLVWRFAIHKPLPECSTDGLVRKCRFCGSRVRAINQADAKPLEVSPSASFYQTVYDRHCLKERLFRLFTFSRCLNSKWQK